MADRPSALWKGMPPDARVQAAEAFWRDEDSPEVGLQQAEAAQVLARRLKFRVKSILSLPVERRARQLAQVTDLSDSIATRALIAYHFASQRPLMAAFLDALGIAHEDGLITADETPAPGSDAVAGAMESLKGQFEAADVDLYLRTLAALDEDTWVHVEAALTTSRA